MTFIMNNLNKAYIHLFVAVFFVFLSLNIQAQNESRSEQIDAMRIAFITKNLNLSPQEAQSFWPVYNTYSDIVSKLHKTERSLLKSLRTDIDGINEKQAEEALSNHLKIQSEKTNARKDLVTNLDGVIPAKKILKLLKAEEDFKRSILERLKARRQRFNKENR